MLWIAKARLYAISAFFALVIPYGLAQAQTAFTPWLSRAEFHQTFDQHKARKFYPVAVEGRNEGGERQYRARFVPYPPGAFAFESRNGATVEWFNQRNAELNALGFTLIHEQRFTDAQGTAVQGVWTKYEMVESDPGVRH